MNIKPRYVRPRDAAALIPCGTTKLYELIKSGALETKHFGGSTLVSVESIDRFHENLPAAKPRPAPYAEKSLAKRRKLATTDVAA